MELDALPLPVLQQKIKDSIEDQLDMEAFNHTKTIEDKEIGELANIFDK